MKKQNTWHQKRLRTATRQLEEVRFVLGNIPDVGFDGSLEPAKAISYLREQRELLEHDNALLRSRLNKIA